MIKTLEKTGIQSVVYLGNINNEEKDLKNFDFEINQNEIRYDKGKLNSFIEQLKFGWNISKKISLRNDIQFVQCCGLATIIGGILIKRKNKSIKLIFDNTELSVERETGIKHTIWKTIQKYALKYCDHIILPEFHRLNFFKNKYNVDDRKLVMIGNYPYLIAVNKPKVNYDDKKNIKVVYLGIIGKGRSLPELIAAAKDIENCSFDFIGPGEEKYLKKLIQMIKGISNIKILPPVENYKIPEVLKNYDIGIAFYENTNLNNYFCAPNKIYDYLNNGLPVITNDYPGLVDIVEKNKVGVCLREISKSSLSEAIKEIINNNYKLNITDELKRRYSWNEQESVYLNLFVQS
ncbi:MAG: glycosyltransferase [Ignavibacteria bacterium]|nr:glycosyltransferase [Ignavibacteria bacterium]